MYNKVVLIGNLGKDPESKTLENGNVVTRCTVATSESYKDKEGNWQNLTEWHNVVIWKKLPESIKKGSTVFVEGAVKTRSYKDANGVDKYVTEINAMTIRGLDKPSASAPVQNVSAPAQATIAPVASNTELLNNMEEPPF
jgi:single-strand DNA-binding protein